MIDYFYLLGRSGDKRIRNLLSFFLWPFLLPFFFIYFFVEFRILRKDIILVYTYGKSASTSVLMALRESGLMPIQLHYWAYKCIFQEARNNLFSKKLSLPLHLIIAFVVRIGFDTGLLIPFKTVIIKREDDNFWISDYFQNLDRYGRLVVRGEVLVNRLNIVREIVLRRYSVWKRYDFPEFEKTFTSSLFLDFALIQGWSNELTTYFKRKVVVGRYNDSKEKFYGRDKLILINYLLKS